MVLLIPLLIVISLFATGCALIAIPFGILAGVLGLVFHSIPIVLAGLVIFGVLYGLFKWIINGN